MLFRSSADRLAPRASAQMRRVRVGVHAAPPFSLASLSRTLTIQPSPYGRGVHERGLLVEAIVHRDDLAAHRRVELRHGLHRFDGAEHVVLRERRADLRQLDEHDVAELALRVVGDADGDDVRRRRSASRTRGLPCTAGPSECRTRRAPWSVTG